MICPRCNREIEANRPSCLYCGFVVPVSFPDTLSMEQLQRRGWHSSLHATRIVSTTDVPDEHTDKRKALLSGSGPSSFPPSSPSVSIGTEGSADLVVGSSLGSNRYRLIEKIEHQQWANDVYEASWKAQDLLQKGATVTLCELGLPEKRIVARQVYLRAAMKTLFKIGTHPLLPALTNVFRDSGRDLFVFQAVEGETLLARIQRTGRPLLPQEVIAGCLQIVEVLEAAAQQEAAPMHGLIAPEHIFITESGRWLLTNFSVVLASGGRQYLQELDPSLFSPFTSPEFKKGIIDSRSDLYALLATAYFGVTGKVLTDANGIISINQLLAARLPPSFEALLKKGLHPLAHQRYQQIVMLHQDLHALLSDNNAVELLSEWQQAESTPYSQQRSQVPPTSGVELKGGIDISLSRFPQEKPFSVARQEPDPVVQVFSSLGSLDERGILEEKLLPKPEDLPPMQQGNARLAALFWMVGILVCFLIPVFVK